MPPKEKSSAVSSESRAGEARRLVDEPVTLRPRTLLAVVGRVVASAVGAGLVVAPIGEGRSLVVGGGRRGAAVPVGAEVVVLVADEQQRPVAVAHLLVAVHRWRPRSLYESARTHTQSTSINAKPESISP